MLNVGMHAHRLYLTVKQKGVCPPWGGEIEDITIIMKKYGKPLAISM